MILFNRKDKSLLITFQLTKHKFFELQLDIGPLKYRNYNPFEISFHVDGKEDHSGIRFLFAIDKYFFFVMQVYDHRHWNFEKDTWQEYDAMILSKRKQEE
jgi:hypothetical protein